MSPILGWKYGTELETSWEPALLSPSVPACARELIFSLLFVCFGVLVWFVFLS